MDAETQKKLRAPFEPAQIGKLPRVTCGNCSRDKQRKHCDRHQRAECRVCGSYISTAHLHLDYVGHAAITDRLLAVDPTWSWEPLAIGPDGLPVRDREGGLWIRLTVAGVTRLGYGDADGKAGPSAVKEAIGDALRNGAMRFGVALDLWHKDGELHQDTDDPAPAQPAEQQSQQQRNGAQNGRQASAGPARDTRPPADTAPAQDDTGGNPEAFAVIESATKEHGWDPRKVAARYKQQFGEDPRGVKSVPRATAFVKLMEGVADELRPEVAANGVAQ
jgi:hypothetical protein